jgi:hypothetical protein
MATALFVVPKSMPQIEAEVSVSRAATARRHDAAFRWIGRVPRAKDDDAEDDVVGAGRVIARMVRCGVQKRMDGLNVQFDD